MYDFFDQNTVKKLVTEHIEGKQNRRLLIWSLLSFEWWLRKYIGWSQTGFILNISPNQKECVNLHQP